MTNAIAVRGHLIAAAKADLAWLERRHKRWEAECASRSRPRDEWWLHYSTRETIPAIVRLEQLLAPEEALEVDVTDPAEAAVQQ